MPKPIKATGDIADAKNAVVFMPNAASVAIADGKGIRIVTMTDAQFREIKAILERATK